MRLEVGHIFIKDIQFGAESKIEDGVLYVSEEAVKEVVLEDEHIKSVKFDIARPGESVRITPVKDVIEPRVKVEGRGGIFPGVISKVDTVGEGKTYALKGMAVVTAGKIVGFQEGVIDMSGPAADYCPFSKTVNLCVVIEPQEGLETHVYEKAGRMAGLKVAAYLGETGRNVEPDTLETFREQSQIFRAGQQCTRISRRLDISTCFSLRDFSTIHIIMVLTQNSLFLHLCTRPKLWTVRSFPVTV